MGLAVIRKTAEINKPVFGVKLTLNFNLEA